MSALHDQLHALAAHVRDPSTHAGPPGIEDRRLRVYRELVFNNLDGLLAGNFPVIRKTLGDADWQALLRDFLVRHRSETPLFTRLGLEFVAFLEIRKDAARPWLAELAHYEWAELGLQLSAAMAPPHDPQGDLLAGIPLLSPQAWPLAYTWPVDRIGPAHQPVAPPPDPTLVLLRRMDNGHVQFSRLSPLLYQLLIRFKNNQTHSGHTLLQQLAAEAGAQNFEAFLAEAEPMLARLRSERVLLGTRIV